MSRKRPTNDIEDASGNENSKNRRLNISEDVPTNGPQQHSRNETYTVGWISALSTEYVAAQVFLDETHDPPDYVHPYDHNNYTLGRMGKHNVVIAVLPNSEYGTCSATEVAKDMLHTFPNIRFGLMVGIGGGAPSPKHDIRLGDIVVSAPGNGKSGVFQYDFGKTIQNQDFQPTGFLNMPPKVLLGAVNGLKARYETDGHEIDKAIDNALEKKPRLQKKYGRPSPESDRLYKSTVIHPQKLEADDNEATCAKICGDHVSENLKKRDDRPESEDNPAIHYGLIASGNQLMKDALFRDKLAKNNDVLCFEMEAAGLMNHFPCLVVRGICDYADTHKNKEWQGYAAMTAAAYAKDIVCCILPNKVEAERRISDLLSSANQDLHEIRYNVRDIRLDQMQEKIERWLSPSDPSTNYNKALQQRQEGTGTWFLQGPAFIQWKEQKCSPLWIYGKPGSGKTILSATIIEELQKTLHHQPLVYFYFDFKDSHKQTLGNMIRSLVSQLYCKCEDTQKYLESLFTSCENGRRQPSSKSLCQALLQMIHSLENVYIVLDALDECHTRKGASTEGLLSWIKNLLGSEQKKNVHLLATSRPEQDITNVLSNLAPHENIVSIDCDLTRNDIFLYVRARVRESDELKRWRSYPEVQDDIEIKLIHTANGMFRWVACQVDVLENCLDYPTLKAALNSLPKTLEETYSRIIDTIPPEHKQHATRILQLVTYSETPISIEEAVDAIAVNTDDRPYFRPEYRMPDPQEIVRYCKSLVAVVPNLRPHLSKRVELHLAHFTVKEYLTSNRLTDSIAKDLQESTARAAIAKVCIAYLLHFDQLPRPDQLRRLDQLHQLDRLHRNDRLTPDEKLQQITIRFPFTRYSARFWMTNTAAVGGKDERLLDLLKQLFWHHKFAYTICYSFYRPDGLSRYLFYLDDPEVDYGGERVVCYEDQPPALYYAALGGLFDIVEYLLHMGADINANGGRYGNALQAASVTNHESITKLLLDNGASVNAQGGEYGNALRAASAKGHEQVVKILLSKGSDINAQSGEHGSALQAASLKGHESIVKFLLDMGANVNAQGGKYGNALQAASAKGHELIIGLLLDNGANIDAHGGKHGNALYATSVKGYEQIVKQLLNRGANVNAQGGEHGTALQAASVKGHEAIVRLLLDKGANVNDQGRVYGTALQAALVKGHEPTIRLLLSRGANINAQGGKHGSALYAAIEEGQERLVKISPSESGDVGAQGEEHGKTRWLASTEEFESIVKLLLDNGANVNAQGGEYGNALQVASVKGHESIVGLLLDKGADVNMQGGRYNTALQAASAKGYWSIIELLLNRGANVNAQGGKYGNALQAASAQGYRSIVRILLDKGADVNTQGGCYNTALQAAAATANDSITNLLLDKGADSITKLLLDKGADVNLQGGTYGSAFQAALESGSKEIAKLLFDKGADVNIRGGYYGNPLQAALVKGNEQMVWLLLEKGAEINTQGGKYGNALQAASLKGYEQVVKLLLDRGANVNAQGGEHSTALQAASLEGYEQVVKLLLDRGANVNAQGGEYGTALQAASVKGHEAIVRLLLDKGADVNAQGGCYVNAIRAASAKGHKQVVALLRSQGAYFFQKQVRV